MLRTAEDDEEHVCLDFSDPNPRRGEAYGYDSFGVCLYSFVGQTIAEHTDLEYQILFGWERGGSWGRKRTDYGLRY